MKKCFQAAVPFAIGIAFAVLFSGCFTDWKGDDSGQARLTLVLGGNSPARAAVPFPPDTDNDPDVYSKLSYYVELSNETESIIYPPVKAQTTIEAVVASGEWKIAVFTIHTEPSDNNKEEIYAAGYMKVDLQPGSDNVIPVMLFEAKLVDKFGWLKNNAANGAEYTFEVKENESLAPQELNYGGKKVAITLISDNPSAVRTVSLSGNGSMFEIGAGVTLSLGSNITLQGHGGNNASLVSVGSGAKLEMYPNSKITGNNAPSGAGVNVGENGIFTMIGGEIFGNTTFGSGGAGVNVWRGTLIIGTEEPLPSTTDPSISDNHALYNQSIVYSGQSGGVAAWESTVTMHSGRISGNTAEWSNAGLMIGGEANSRGTFTMTGGEISDNTTLNKFTHDSQWGLLSGEAGGVYVNNYGTFIMNGGTISGNEIINSGGGGVAVGTDDAIFIMNGGTIGPNNKASEGGGVIVKWGGTFTMPTGSTGIISGNEASSIGGGVYVTSGGTFTMNGGTIGGSNVDGNTVTNSNGNGGGVYVGSDGTFRMNGGLISFNEASYGGGVSLWEANFDKNGGIIQGNTAPIGGQIAADTQWHGTTTKFCDTSVPTSLWYRADGSWGPPTGAWD